MIKSMTDQDLFTGIVAIVPRAKCYIVTCNVHVMLHIIDKLQYSSSPYMCSITEYTCILVFQVLKQDYGTQPGQKYIDFQF